MDEMLNIAIRAFLATVGTNVADPVTQTAIEKVDEALTRVADGKMSATEAAVYIRELVTVLS
jgi:hypothetical protein